MARSRFSVSIVVVVAGLLAGPASADLLVTRGGEVVETRGEWEVRGKLVLFTGTDGNLRSLRTVDVDLEASEHRTQEASEARRSRESARAAEASEDTKPAAKKAVLVLTDADVRHVRTVEAAPHSARSEVGEGRATDGIAGEEDGQLQVSDWSENVGEDGVEIRGTLRNPSEGLVAGVSLMVDLIGNEGNVLESGSARVDRLSLAAGESAGFTVSFATLALYQGVEFRPSGTLLARNQRVEQAAAEQ